MCVSLIVFSGAGGCVLQDVLCRGCVLSLKLGKRRYDRKQRGYGGQTKPVFHKKVSVCVCVCVCVCTHVHVAGSASSSHQ